MIWDVLKIVHIFFVRMVGVNLSKFADKGATITELYNKLGGRVSKKTIKKVLESLNKTRFAFEENGRWFMTPEWSGDPEGKVLTNYRKRPDGKTSVNEYPYNIVVDSGRV